MRFLISAAWHLSDTAAPTGFGDDLASFVLREQVDRTVIANVIAPGVEPWKVFGSVAFHDELDEFSPLVRNAHQIGLHWILGAGDRVLGNPKFAHIKARLENRGVTFVDSPAPVLEHDQFGRPKLVMVMTEGNERLTVVEKPRATPWSWLRPRIITIPNMPCTEAGLRAMALQMSVADNVRVVLHDLPVPSNWQRIGPHAGQGVWFGCPGQPPNVLLLDPDEPWGAKLIRL